MSGRRRARQHTQAIQLREDLPWHESVDGASLLLELEQFLTRYVVFPAGGSLTAAAWSLSGYFMDCFDSHPLLIFSSPDRRCGKTRALEALECVCLRPVRAAGMSESALFRIITSASPTLLIDEAQSLRHRDERSAAMHDLLCAANRRGAVVLRVGGPDRDRVEKFPIFGPKVLAAIGTLSEVILDRAIQISMRRRRASEHVARFFLSRADEEATPLRRRMVRWSSDRRDDVARWYQQSAPPDFLQDREAEGWAALFAVVAVADPGTFPRLEEAARVLTGAQADAVAPSAGVRLLADIQAVFAELGEERLATERLLAMLHDRPESPWKEWRNGRPLSDVQLAALLRAFGPRPQAFRDGARVIRGYGRGEFDEPWSRYLQPATPATFQAERSDSQFSDVQHREAVAGRESAESPRQSSGVAGVALPQPILPGIPADGGMRAALLRCGQSLGWPGMAFNGGSVVVLAGEASWRQFAAQASDDAVAVVLRELERWEAVS